MSLVVKVWILCEKLQSAFPPLPEVSFGGVTFSGTSAYAVKIPVMSHIDQDKTKSCSVLFLIDSSQDKDRSASSVWEKKSSFLLPHNQYRIQAYNYNSIHTIFGYLIVH